MPCANLQHATQALPCAALKHKHALSCDTTHQSIHRCAHPWPTNHATILETHATVVQAPQRGSAPVERANGIRSPPKSMSSWFSLRMLQSTERLKT